MEQINTADLGFAGTLNNVQLSDIIQMWCVGGVSTVTRVTKDSCVGTIYLVEGEVVHAKTGDLVGEEAFYTILGWAGGSFESIAFEIPEQATIEQQWQYLLMEACRRVDEDIGADSVDTAEIPNLDEPAPRPADSLRDSAIRVLIVDDSVMMRKALAGALDDDDFIIVGNAANGAEAMDLIPQVKPDVITLDVNMPVMDGISALKRIMIQGPIPTLMVSALTHEGATLTFDTLKYGAVDFLSKPSNMVAGEMEAQINIIRDKVRLAAQVEISAVRYIRAGFQESKAPSVTSSLEVVVALGAGEGGYGTLLKIVPQLKGELAAAIVGVLYAAPSHVEAFARYLDHHSSISVKRAKDGSQLVGGTCYLTSGEEYTTIEMVDGKPTLQITPSSFPARRGSTNILMISLAEKMGNRAVGMVLSGASKDGAEGINEIVHMGGTALIQAPNTCLMREMPEAALATCVSGREVPDDKMAAEIMRLVETKKSHNIVN